MGSLVGYPVHPTSPEVRRKLLRLSSVAYLYPLQMQQALEFYSAIIGFKFPLYDDFGT